MERSTIFHGKIHYFYGHFQLLFVSSPEGINHHLGQFLGNLNPISKLLRVDPTMIDMVRPASKVTVKRCTDECVSTYYKMTITVSMVKTINDTCVYYILTYIVMTINAYYN